MEGAAVLDGLTRGHHHTTTDGVNGVGSETGTNGDTPTEKEGGGEVVGEVTDKELVEVMELEMLCPLSEIITNIQFSDTYDGLERVVHTEVKTTVDNDTSARNGETTVETGNTV